MISVRHLETGKCGFLNKTGKFAIVPKFTNVAPFSEGLARVSIVENYIEMLGFINTDGKFIIPPKFDIDGDFLRNSTNFSEDMAGVIDGPLEIDKDSCFNFIDRSGNNSLKTKFFYASSFHEGLASVYDENTNKFGFIDKSGQIIIPLKYEIAGDFSEGLAYVVTKN